MVVFFILCLLSVLLSTSAQGNLTCQKCYGLVQNCENPTETCTVLNGTGGCRSVAAQATLGNTVTSALYKECISDYNSGIKDSITFTVGSGLYLRLNATRCNDTNNCNSDVMEVPTVNTSLNGLQCPTCFSPSSDSCIGQITPCTGNEIHCIDFTGQMLIGTSLSPFAAQGCGSASTQDIKSQAYLISGKNMYLFSRASSVPASAIPTTATATATPSNATVPPQTNATLISATPTPSRSSAVLGQFSSAVYLPGLTGLLLLKLLS